VAKTIPENSQKEPNANTWGQKKANHFFPILAAVAKLCELICSNFLKGDAPQSQMELNSKTSPC